MPNTVVDPVQDCIHVAVGVLFNAAGDILLTLRHPHQHQGGLWEFPGGKVEAGETVLEALVREFQEEVQLQVSAAEAMLTIQHDYSDKRVLLDVWRIQEWEGEVYGSEGQRVSWVPLSALKDYPLPAANKGIVSHLLLEAGLLV